MTNKGTQGHERLVSLIALGITHHENLGLIDGCYVDVVRVGPLERRFTVDWETIERAKSPISRRYNMLKNNIECFHNEIRRSFELNSSK